MKKKTGMNEQCPCGSGKKYKKCYNKKDLDCFLFKKKEYERKEEVVISFLTETSEEINYCTGYNEKGDPIVPAKAQLVLLFVLADILSKYWDIYNENNNTPKVYFPAWFDNFCLTESNNSFKNDPYIKMFTSKNFYDLRNSLLHFYGIPRESLGIKYIIAPDNQIIKNTKTKNDLCHLIKQLVGSDKEGYRLVQVKQIKKLIWNGSIAMIKAMKRNLTNKPNLHIRGIDMIYEEVNQRGTFDIEMDKN